MVILTAVWAEKPVREEKGFFIPIGLTPALQKADTEWNKADHMPFQNPNSPKKAGAIMVEPNNSISNVAFGIKPVRQTIPPTLGVDRASLEYEHAFIRFKGIFYSYGFWRFAIRDNLRAAIIDHWYSAIYLDGGNTYKLLKEIKESGFDKKVIQLLSADGLVCGDNRI